MKRIELRVSKVDRPGNSAVDPNGASTRWPDEDFFMLENPEDFKKLRNPEREWIGVYRGMSPGVFQGEPIHELLCASRSPSVLFRRLKPMSASFPVFVRRASDRSLLPQQLTSAPPEPLAQLRRKAYDALFTHRHLLDPTDAGHPMVPLKGFEWFFNDLVGTRKIEHCETARVYNGLRKLFEELSTVEERAAAWTPMQPLDYSHLADQFTEATDSARRDGAFRVSNIDAQAKIDRYLEASKRCLRNNFDRMRQAADFLRDVRNEAKRKGSPVGDRSTAKQTRRAIEIFRGLASGKSLKEIAVDEAGEDYERRLRSLSVTVSRFEKRIAKAVHARFGPNLPSLNYLYLLHALENWLEIDRRKDRDALLEAARRGLPNVKFSLSDGAA